MFEAFVAPSSERVRSSLEAAVRPHSEALCLILAYPRPLRAHADLDEQIAAVTHQIEKDVTNAQLCLKRGELHRVHRDWKSGAVDYDAPPAWTRAS